MFQSKFGLYNGTTWESLLQQIFKDKHGAEGYQEIKASPGDFGIEGYVSRTGVAFQCYCPEKHYDQDTLYEKQRDKITKDIVKLKTNEVELGYRLGGTLINSWCFVTPEINHNKLLKHAKTKEAEARNWNLGILSPNFSIYLHDGDFYSKEIHAHKALQGEAIDVQGLTLETPKPNDDSIEYEDNILRKTKLRVAAGLGNIPIDMNDSTHKFSVDRTFTRTIESFLNYSRFHEELDKASPLLYYKIKRILSAFNEEVLEWTDTLHAPADELTEKVKVELRNQLMSELKPHVDFALASKIVAHEVAYWLGACQLDYRE